MTAILNIETAKAYLLSIVPDAVIGEAESFQYDAEQTGQDDLPVVSVDFTIPGSDRICNMHVWIEGDKLYGEW